jgi:hypothetical protein
LSGLARREAAKDGEVSLLREKTLLLGVASKHEDRRGLADLEYFRR